MSILKAIEKFERVVITGTEHLMREMSADSNTMFQQLTKEQRELLMFIDMKEQVSPSDLAKFQGVKKSTLSNRLNKLIQGGYITYGQNSYVDKRYRSIQTTAKGANIVKINKEKSRAVFQELFADFSEGAELDTFLELLAVIQKQIDSKGEIK